MFRVVVIAPRCGLGNPWWAGRHHDRNETRAFRRRNPVGCPVGRYVWSFPVLLARLESDGKRRKARTMTEAHISQYPSMRLAHDYASTATSGRGGRGRR